MHSKAVYCDKTTRNTRKINEIGLNTKTCTWWEVLVSVGAYMGKNKDVLIGTQRQTYKKLGFNQFFCLGGHQAHFR